MRVFIKVLCVTFVVGLVKVTEADESEPRYIEGKTVYTINTPIYDRSDSRVFKKKIFKFNI